MNFECIIYEKNQGIATIKLNRPKVLNAMNKQLWLDFQAALEDARIDSDIKVLVVTGEGRAFSTGASSRRRRKASSSTIVYPEIAMAAETASRQQRFK